MRRTIAVGLLLLAGCGTTDPTATQETQPKATVDPAARRQAAAVAKDLREQWITGTPKAALKRVAWTHVTRVEVTSGDTLRLYLNTNDPGVGAGACAEASWGVYAPKRPKIYDRLHAVRVIGKAGETLVHRHDEYESCGTDDLPDPTLPRVQPAPKPKPKPKPTPTTTGTDPQFASCAEAIAHGYGPYTAGDPEFGWYQDGDGDGTVCGQ